MKWTLSTICLFFCISMSQAQVDSVKFTSPQDTVPLKEAPEALKQLLQDIIEEEAAKVKKDAVLEIDGLLIDDTMTKSGRDFFDLFYRDWAPPEGAYNYTIFIEEKPFRMNITMVEVSINETLVFQSFLQPRAEIIEELAAQSVETTHAYLLQYEQIVKELEGDDRSGSGIF